jgi:solute carrier family 25 (mitochondrial adenine nucleotide translocator), member 4/5/6/31
MSKEKKNGYLQFSVDFLLGGISGAIDKTLTAPIERTKLLIQTQDANLKIRSGEVQRYTSLSNCFRRVYHEQGLLSFWRGNLTNIIRYFPTQAFNFAFKDSIKPLFPKYDITQDFNKFLMVQLASGAIAGVGSLCIVYPLDYARTRLAADVGSGKRDFKGLGDCLIKTTKGPNGFLGLYNGFGISVVGIIPYRGVYFGLFDTLKEKNPYKLDKGVIGFVSTFCIAQFSSIVAGYGSYPFDTIRRRLQMQSEKPKEEWIYKGSIDCTKRIFKEEGVNAFFKGAGANAVRTIGSALVLVLYDFSQKYFGLN